MSGPGANREHEGEMDFSPEELVEMKVEVAGREEAGSSRRRKRSLRVPADEVPRSTTTSISTEPDLEAIQLPAGQEGDELVEHAFSNGGRAEGDVRAERNFVAAETAEVDGADPHTEGERARSSADEPKQMRSAMARLPPNVRALVAAVAPAAVAERQRRIDSGEIEQLDSDELEVDEARLDSPAGEVPALHEEPALAALEEEPASKASVAAPPVLALEDGDDEVEAEETDQLAMEAEDDEFSAVEVTEDDAQDLPPRERRRTLPPAMPRAATAPLAQRKRSQTPVVAPASGISPATAPLSPPPPPQAEADGSLRPRRRRRAKQWFEEIFDDDYLRTLPYLSPKQTEREATFIAESLELSASSSVLDLACGYGRHAMELSGRGHKVTGLDLSLPLLIRAADAARRIGVAVNFVHGDMREMTFDAEFDSAYCMFTSFGYFDDDTNRKVAANLQRALRPGGKVLIELINRDYITRDLPTRVWWQGEGCVVLEEVDFNYFSSRLQVQRSTIFEDGRQLEHEISIRAYSLHEIGKVLHHAGFRVIEVSGGLGLRGKFFGAHSRQLLVLAEKKTTP
jgi:SAM-dependent methyltransferase